MKKTVTTFAKAKASGEKLTMLTAYDYSTAKLMDEAGVDSILVGDSLGNVVLGYEDTVSVTMEDMIHHGAAVARGAKEALVVIDMPFMSYQTSVCPVSEGVQNSAISIYWISIIISVSSICGANIASLTKNCFTSISLKKSCHTIMKRMQRIRHVSKW